MSKPREKDLKVRCRTCTLCALFTMLILAMPLPALCQTNITPDGSIGTTVNQVGNVFDINGGKIMGSNQFQSFDKFSVGSGDIASFNGPAGIDNILSRVTGGELSNINGTLRSTINGANLFFFNPSGVVFGPDAALDVTGSFYVSTADLMQFADGAKFFADLSQDSVLTAAAPEAFGFLSADPASITLEDSFLDVPAGKTLSVIGGDIEMKGGALIAPSSRINLASAGSPGEVIPTQSDLEVTSATLGQIGISDGASVNASGAPFPGDGAGGTVVIRAGKLTVADRPTPFDPTIVTDTSGFVDGAETGIDVKVTGEMSVIGAAIRSAASPSSFGNAGNIVLDVGSLSITDGSVINSSTSFFAIGAGGDIIVNARDGVSVIDAQITSQTAFAIGDGGRISITAPEVELQGGFNATVNSSTSGGGLVGGNAGDIVLDVSRLTVGEDAGIDSTTENSLGDAGNIFISATEEVLVSSPNSIFRAVIRTSNLTGPGDAGNVVVETPRLTLTDGGIITSTTDGMGKGGSIIAEAPGGGGMPSDEVFISGLGSGIFTDTTADGTGGEIKVTANKVILTDEGSVSAKATGIGDAGNLTIVSGSFTSENGSLSTEAEMSDGGNIELTAGSVVDLFKSTITAEAKGPAQSGSDGGNVSILGDNVALNRSTVLANAFGGDGGNIDIVAKVFLASTDSIVDASSALGIDGEVNVDAGVRVLTGTLAPLPDVFLSGVDLLRNRCKARYREGLTSSFILGGRDRVPTEPGDLLPSPYQRKKPSSIGYGLGSRKTSAATSLAPTSIVLSQLGNSTKPRLRGLFLEQKCTLSEYRQPFIYRDVISTAKDS